MLAEPGSEPEPPGREPDILTTFVFLLLLFFVTKLDHTGLDERISDP